MYSNDLYKPSSVDNSWKCVPQRQTRRRGMMRRRGDWQQPMKTNAGQVEEMGNIE
jgi:hypothetical protein